MTHVNNYTISELTYSNIIAGTAVADEHPTAVLILTPDEGYTINADDFSLSGPLPTGVSDITFTQHQANIYCTLTFDAGYIMPSNNVEIPLCFNGVGVLKTFHVTGQIDPNEPYSNYDITPSTIYSFDEQGAYQSNVLIYDITLSAYSGYYFPTHPSVVQVSGDTEIFSYETTDYTDLDGNLIGCVISIICTIPNNDSFDNNFLVRAFASEIYIPTSLITDYTFDTSVVSVLGDIRLLTLIGGSGANWNLSSNIPVFLTGDSDPVTHMPIISDTLSGVMGDAGFTEIKVIFPKNSVTTEYDITLSGDLIDPFPNPTTIILNQLADVTTMFRINAGSRYSIANISTEDRTYAAFGIPPIGVGVAEVVNQWRISSSDGGTLNLDGAPVSTDVDNWSIISRPITRDADNSYIIQFRDLDGIEVGMDLIDPLTNINNTITSIDIYSNEVTLTYPVTIPNGNTVSVSFNKGNLAAFSFETVQEDPYTIKITENALVTQFGYEDATFSFTPRIRQVVTSYNIDPSDIFSLGETRTYFVFGDPFARFVVTTYDGHTTTTVADAMVDLAGEYHFDIVFPPLPGGSGIDWTITITGDLASTFDTPGNQSSTIILHQTL